MARSAGVAWPEVEGRRSTARTGAAILADAARAADPELAERIAGAEDWRASYVGAVRDLTATAREAGNATAIAAAGLTAAATRLEWVRDGEAVPLAAALGRAPAGVPSTTVVRGTAAPERELAVPYRDGRLTGTALVAALEDWVARGVVEPSVATAVGEVARHPEWLRLENRTIALLGAGAELGPLAPLSAWGADVLAVDVAHPAVWSHVLGIARRGAGSVAVPVRGAPVPSGDPRLPARAGLDMAEALDEVSAWLDAAAGDGELVLANHAYADGGAHVLVSAAADALAADLLARRPGTALAGLATPTDAFLVGEDVVAAARARRPRGGARAVLEAPVRRFARGRLFAPAYEELVEDERGRRYGIADALVPQQGPNYALAKRLQRWRAVDARAAGHLVSFNVAPASWTRSVTKNRVLAAAYGGAHRFGVEIFAPATTRVLMAALLVHDLQAGRLPADEHPEALFATAAAHGGLWRSPYAPRSVLGLAALAGLPRALR